MESKEIGIEADKFWTTFSDIVKELYDYNPLHIYEMRELQDRLGLEYIETHTLNQKFVFRFKVKDRNKVLKMKIHYGV